MALSVAVAVILQSPSAAVAQVAMPDPSAIAGTPLPAPELADSTITVRVVRERMGNNVSGQVVTLRVGAASRTATTDAQGRAQFDGIAAGTLVQASTTVDGEALTSQEFPVPAKGGVRIALIAGIARAAAAEKAAADAGAKEAPRPGAVEFGPESRIIFEFQSDALTGFYLLEVINSARTPIDIGGPLLMKLPTGAAGAAMMQGSSPNASVRGDMLTITGPFAPGKTIAQVGFSVPNAGASTVIRQALPAAMAQVFIAAEKIGPMQMSSPQLTETREVNNGGQVFIMGTGGRLNAGDTLVVNFSGLPAHSQTPRNLALLAVVMIFAIGFWMAWSPRRAHAEQDARLAARRERLLGEVATLERKRRTKADQPKGWSPQDEARLQRATSELEQVMAALDVTAAPGGEGSAA